MDESTIATGETGKEATGRQAYGCPAHTLPAQRREIEAEDELIFPKHKRVIAAYSTDAAGVLVLEQLARSRE